jgi:hypothetical protein
VVPVVEGLPKKCEALGSIPSTGAGGARSKDFQCSHHKEMMSI